MVGDYTWSASRCPLWVDGVEKRLVIFGEQ